MRNRCGSSFGCFMPDLNTRARDALQRLHEAGRIRSPWLAGTDYRYSDPSGNGGIVGCVDVVSGVAVDMEDHKPIPVGSVPNTSDPLTVMGLLLLLREAEDLPCVYVGNDCDGWYVDGIDSVNGFGEKRFATEREAIVAALEAVAGRTP